MFCKVCKGEVLDGSWLPLACSLVLGYRGGDIEEINAEGVKIMQKSKNDSELVFWSTFKCFWSLKHAGANP